MTLRIGILGCGAISEFHLRAAAGRSDCHIVACADVNPESARHRAAQFGIPRALADSESLLRLDELDLVVICTPPKWHAEFALRALELGKHVLVEKPLAMNLSEADAIITAACQTDRIVGVALMHRYLPVYHAARDLLERGAVGLPRLVRLSLGKGMYHDSRFRTPENDPRSWLTNYDIAGGGMLMSSSIHFFSVVSYLLGDPVALQVAGRARRLHPDAFAGIEDDVDLVVRWNNGVEYTHRESWATDLPYQAELTGDDGRLLISGSGFTAQSLRPECKNRLPPPYDRLLRDGLITGDQLQSHHPAPLLFDGLWSDLVESIQRRAHVPRLPDLWHARHMQAIVAAAYQAEATGQPCAVDWRPNKSRGNT